MGGTPSEAGLVGDVGDDTFERSREKALIALERFPKQARQKGLAKRLAEQSIEIKTGKAIEYSRIADIPKRWRERGREAQPTERHLQAV